MRPRVRVLYLLAVALVCMLSFSACKIKYTIHGSTLNYNIYKTINISEFPIRAALVYPPLQQTFENELLDVVIRQTSLQEVDSPNADLELSGEITGYALSPQAVGEDAYATQTRLTITVRVKYVDRHNEANNVDQTFSAYRDFSSTEMLTDVQDELCQQISEDLVNLIFNATLGNW